MKVPGAMQPQTIRQMRGHRGQRWDESRPGTGFGIAIARDVAEAAGAQLDFGRSELGGLRAELRWPGG